MLILSLLLTIPVKFLTRPYFLGSPNFFKIQNLDLKSIKHSSNHSNGPSLSHFQCIWVISSHFQTSLLTIQSNFLRSPLFRNLDLKSIRHNSDPQKRVQGPFRSIHVKFGTIWSNKRPQRALVDFLVS